MNILLLSGGSGKRLWPLSNDIRSKQFIKLFKDDNGNYESMVQRVYRQISAADSQANITIVSSRSQASAIHNQLGERVSICAEPCRRDTFPAIALAAAYLADELNVEKDECIVVCPVDPYVNDSYYETVAGLEALVKKNTSNIALLGIEPTYPSDKYGYIIPEDTSTISRVREFKEKPDAATAEKYLKQGALWNAGVFACKLSYLISRAHEMIDFTDYRDLYEKYETLNKISFDYAVVEKETSIEVVRYAGEWRDVGTWNMVAEVMADAVKGDVTLDDNCRNTQVVNELDIPVLVMGARDMVVAASGDGILISDKECVRQLNSYTKKIRTDTRYAEKSWGTYTVLDAQPRALTVKVSLQSGSRMTYHAHELRDEVWTIISGYGRTVIDGMEQTVRPGDTVSIAAGCVHTIIADTDMDVIEVQVGDEINQQDKRIFPVERELEEKISHLRQIEE